MTKYDAETDMKANGGLSKDIEKNLNIFVIGAGVVGKATGKGLIKKGHNVTFIDIDLNTVRELRGDGLRAYTWDQLQQISEDKFLHSIMPDITMFSVSTPFGKATDSGVKHLNLDHFESALARYATFMKSIDKYHVLVFRSTILPGTSKTLIHKIERISAKSIGRDFGLCMQPEFLRAKSSEEDFLNPWLTVIGQYDEKSGDVLESLYSGWSGEIIRTDIEIAEFMKLVHNAYNAVKISFANEMWLAGKSLGIDANRALHLASLSAEGFWNPAYGTTGGRPYGGACLPKDVKGFIAYLVESKILPDILIATDKVNTKMEDLSDRKIAEKAIAHGLHWTRSPASNAD